MINFDSIMNFATREAQERTIKRFKESSSNESFSGSLDPEMKDLIEENKFTIILIEEMTKAALKHYHNAIKNEQLQKVRTKF
ncbi:hypothetical protein [Paenibacillus larvae]|uniref:hypothetical protein n=1 Tax=Paenibacillus larvae TaxID=1464 RepID=UPI000169558F|nr:hypothetical protein [Paenibacillus larvae]ETK30376.1 hypothetical protein ERIC1_1c39430 [Paenibacillus larvae subsp. larvae DSM 25719]